ncbi:hypothetical protein FSP39_021316 [Pinctada imbricata]|uniref:F5/8 type C domain-containing protein n=1 Tax=Pinctada imbricata TaxID=66713 RepID=A0AA88YXH5_PINIB|nr:hypothetical protein FSP39_021316 [Pinctada imbricata]
MFSPANRHQPVFKQEKQEVEVATPYGNGEYFFFPETTDLDFESTCKRSEYCPCADVSYYIASGNDEGLFAINPENGALTVKQGSILKKKMYEVSIAAKNTFQGLEATEDHRTIVYVHNPAAEDPLNFESLDRERRSPSSPVDNVTFTLTKMDPYVNTTTMSVGSRVRFQLTITFPAYETDMLVELFTPDNETTVMILCDVSVTSIGSKLVYTGSTNATMDAREAGSIMYDRAIINLGNVSNTGCVNEDECSIKIEYEAVMVDNNETTQNGVYWVSAGAEYNNEMEVWVGQASFTVDPSDKTVSDSPTFNFTGPSVLPIGSAAVFETDMYLPYPSTDINFDAFTPLNTSSVMSICSAKIKYMADNFQCGFDQAAVSTQYYPDPTGVGNYMGHLAMGTLINKGSRDASTVTEDNRVTVQFVAHLYDNPAYINQQYWLGAAFEIGTTQIWAGQLEVTGGAAVDPTGMAAPVVAFDPPAGHQVAIGDPLVLTLTVEIPEITTTSYSLEVKAPYTTEAIFQLCNLQIKTIGSNMPCINTADKKTVYSSRTVDSHYSDTAVLSLGGVTNLNIEAANASADLITFEIIVKPLDVAVVSTSYNVDVTLTYADTQTVTTSASVQVSGTSSLTVLSNTTSPTFNMSFVFGDENVLVGAATRVKLEITTNSSVIYPLMDLEFIMPVGNYSTKFSVCKARVESVGQNLPCVSSEWINTQISYASRFNDVINDRAIMSLGAVCNVANLADSEEDKITITFDVKVEDHADLTHNTKEWVSAGNMYSDTKIWVGQLALYAQRTPTSVIPATTPYINLIKNTTLTSSPIGFPTIYSVLIKTAPQESSKIKITATSNSIGLFVCGLRVKDVGDNLPCVSKTTTAQFTQFSGGGNNNGVLDLGIVTNTGTDSMISNDFYDSNTILVEVLMQLADDTSLVPDSSSHTFDVSVEYDTSNNKRDFLATQITATHDKTTANLTVINRATNSFYTSGLAGNDTNSTDMYPGESKRFNIDIIMPEAETQEVTVKFLTSVSDPNQMEICSAAVTYVGDNFPCLDKTKVSPTFEKRPGSHFVDIASMYLGFVCSSPVKTADNEANKITIEAIARLLPTTTKATGDTVPFHVAVNTNDMEIYVAQMDLTVTDTFTEVVASNDSYNGTIISLNASSSTIPMKIGEVMVFPIVLNVPTMSMSKVLFDVDLPVNDSTIAIVKDIRIVSSGANVGCFYQNDIIGIVFTPAYNSSLGTCENNKATLDLGIITNSGITLRQGTYADGDDSILIDVDIQLQDGEEAEHGAEFWFSFGAKISNYVALYDKKISISRDNTERPVLEMSAVFNSSLSSTSEYVIDVTLKHNNLSTAAGVNTSAMFYLPPYLKFQNMTSNLTEMSVTFSEGTIRITYSKFLLCEIAIITLTLVPNTSIEVPDEIVTDNTMVAYEAGTFMYARAGNSNSNGYFTTDLQYMNFSATVIRADQCGGPLGMETGIIDDCQLSSSIEYDPTRRPSHGRLKRKLGIITVHFVAWCPFIRGASFAKQRYYQVFFGNKTLVNKIEIQTGTGFTHRPTEITLKYSDNGHAWQTGESVVLSPSFVTETIYPTRQVEAKYLRVFIDNDDAPANTAPNIGLKFEFHGCYKSSDYTPTTICSAAPSNSYPNVQNREFRKSETEGIQNQDKTGTKANKQKPPPYEKKRTPDMRVIPGAQEE